MKKNPLILATFFLSILSLPVHSAQVLSVQWFILRTIDSAVLFLAISELLKGLKKSEYRRQFMLKNLPLTGFSALYLLVLAGLFIKDFTSGHEPYINLTVIVFRSLFLLYRGFENVKSIETALSRLNERPALSIIFSFFAVIMVGTLLLMLPFATADGKGLNFIDSWFTATSAVCVTGLIVVDTAAAFSTAGRIIILVLIQIGGLGIMIMTYFSMFILRRNVTLEEKKRLSFVISDTDLSDIIQTLKKIIYLTFLIEAAGAVLLFIGLGIRQGFGIRTVFSAVFHSVSAFCNAGFSLYSDSLEGFAGSPLIILTISMLIIAGGLSFAVLFNLGNYFRTSKSLRRLSLNTKIVLTWTALLLLSGFLFFYAAEHGNTLRNLPTGKQYLAAFFQSVTLRTAGFNTVPFSGFTAGTIVIMCVFMFTGAASGSTAGGIKINTSAVLAAYIKSLVTNSPRVTLYRYQLSKTRVLRAFAVFQYGITAVLAGVAALAFTQNAPLEDILFESVSAFGTVGLSTGLTPHLNIFGKLVIILLMFNGRLGPLTILSTFSGRTDKSGVKYPRGDILIG